MESGRKCGPGSSLQPKNVAVEVRSAADAGRCEFCGKGLVEGNEIKKAGKLFKFYGKYFHYFCVLFSSDIVQTKAETTGLRGFDNSEIQRALRAGQKLTCVKCSRHGATIQCSHSKCDRQYHFLCGKRAGYVFVFHNEMRSFCSKHRPKQKIKAKVQEKTCMAGCMEDVDDHDLKILISPCCFRKMHLDCVQLMGLSSGLHHFKCPACSNKDEFVRVAMTLGVYVPIQDASWETDEDFYSFSTQGALYKRCDAEICRCDRGREYTMNGSYFELIRCENCGCSAVHIKCGGLLKKAPYYICVRHDNAKEDMEKYKVDVRKQPEYSSESECDSDPDQPPPKKKKSTARKSTGPRLHESSMIKSTWVKNEPQSARSVPGPVKIQISPSQAKATRSPENGIKVESIGSLSEQHTFYQESELQADLSAKRAQKSPSRSVSGPRSSFGIIHTVTKEKKDLQFSLDHLTADPGPSSSWRAPDLEPTLELKPDVSAMAPDPEIVQNIVKSRLINLKPDSARVEEFVQSTLPTLKPVPIQIQNLRPIVPTPIDPTYEPMPLITGAYSLAGPGSDSEGSQKAEDVITIDDSDQEVDEDGAPILAKKVEHKKPRGEVDIIVLN